MPGKRSSGRARSGRGAPSSPTPRRANAQSRPVRPSPTRAAPAQGYELPDWEVWSALRVPRKADLHLVWRARLEIGQPKAAQAVGRALGHLLGLHRPLPPGDPGNRGARRLPLGQGAPTRNPGWEAAGRRRLSGEVSIARHLPGRRRHRRRPGCVPPRLPPPAMIEPASRHRRPKPDVQIELRPQTGTSLGVTSTFPRSMHTGAASRDRRVRLASSPTVSPGWPIGRSRPDKRRRNPRVQLCGAYVDV